MTNPIDPRIISQPVLANNGCATASVRWNGVFASLSKVIDSVANAFFTIFLARFLGVEDFGHYALIMAIVGIMIPFVDWGMGITLVREITNRKRPASELLGQVGAFRALMAVMMLVILIMIGMAALATPSERMGLLFCGISWLVVHEALLLPIRSAILAAERMQWDMAIASILQTLRVVAILVSALMGAGLAGLFGGLLLSDVLCAVGTCVFFRKSFALFAWPRAWDGLRTMAVASWPMAVTLAFNMVYLQLGVILLKVFKGEAAVGLFSAPYNAIVGVFAVMMPFIRVYLPAFSRLFHESMARQTEVVEDVAVRYLVVSSCLSILAVVFAKDLIKVLFGVDYAMSAWVLSICIPLIVFRGIDFMGSMVFAAMQRPTLMIPSAGFAVGVNVVLNIVLIPIWGIIGAAIAMLASDIVSFVTTLFLFRFKLGLSVKSYRLLLPPVSGLVILGLWRVGAPSWVVGAGVVVFLSIYSWFRLLPSLRKSAADVGGESVFVSGKE